MGHRLLASPHAAAPTDKGWCCLQYKDSIADPDTGTGTQNQKEVTLVLNFYENFLIALPDLWC